MQNRIFSISYVLLFTLLLAIPAYAQGDGDSCYFHLEIEPAQLSYGEDLFGLEISLENDCLAGGMQFKIETSPSGVIVPYGIDFTGGRIENWELLRVNLGADSSSLKFLGILNMPNPGDPPPLPPGSGRVGTLLCKMRCFAEESLEVSVIVDSALIPSPSGYDVYIPEVTTGTIRLGEDLSVRGDASCDGLVLGADVTFLVNYFRGYACPCTRRSGDANGDGNVIGSDVTYLVNYFRGYGPPPPPPGNN